MRAVILLLISASASAALAGVSEGGSSNFDYFYLVRQWPATFCNDHTCTHSPPNRFKFTIHGMWPQRTDGTWPEYCDPGNPFSVTKILDLLPSMIRAWPSWSGENRVFWSHEWTRHGTCAERLVGGERGFFKAVLGLHKQLRIEDALAAAGIGPSGEKAYEGRVLQRALKDGLGTYHHIFCDAKGNLAEVWSCIGLDLRPFDCGAQRDAPGALPPQNNACGLRVKIPPLDRRYARRGVSAWAGAALAVLVLAVAAVALARRRAAGGGGASGDELRRPLAGAA